MSMILDALRKSEAERRRGCAPDLFVQPTVAVSAYRAPLAHARWWLLASLGVVVVLVWVARDMWMSAPATQRAAAMDEADRKPPPDAAPVDRAPAPAQTADPVPAATAAASAAPPATAPALAPPATMPAPAPVFVTAPVDPGPSPAQPARTATATNARPPAQSDPTIPTPPPAPAPPIVSRAPIPAANTSAEPLSLGALPAEERGQLPPLKMSMHMWNAVAAQRFVILDGARVGEGDRIGEAVVAQINPDGVVLDWRGRRLRVPIR